MPSDMINNFCSFDIEPFNFSCRKINENLIYMEVRYIGDEKIFPIEIYKYVIENDLLDFHLSCIFHSSVFEKKGYIKFDKDSGRPIMITEVFLNSFNPEKLIDINSVSNIIIKDEITSKDIGIYENLPVSLFIIKPCNEKITKHYDIINSIFVATSIVYKLNTKISDLKNLYNICITNIEKEINHYINSYEDLKIGFKKNYFVSFTDFYIKIITTLQINSVNNVFIKSLSGNTLIIQDSYKWNYEGLTIPNISDKFNISYLISYLLSYPFNIIINKDINIIDEFIEDDILYKVISIKNEEIPISNEPILYKFTLPYRLYKVFNNIYIYKKLFKYPYKFLGIIDDTVDDNITFQKLMYDECRRKNLYLNYIYRNHNKLFILIS